MVNQSLDLLMQCVPLLSPPCRCYWRPSFAQVVGFLVVSKPFLDLQHPRHMHSTHTEVPLGLPSHLLPIQKLCSSTFPSAAPP